MKFVRQISSPPSLFSVEPSVGPPFAVIPPHISSQLGSHLLFLLSCGCFVLFCFVFL